MTDLSMGLLGCGIIVAVMGGLGMIGNMLLYVSSFRRIDDPADFDLMERWRKAAMRHISATGVIFVGMTLFAFGAIALILSAFDWSLS